MSPSTAMCGVVASIEESFDRPLLIFVPVHKAELHSFHTETSLSFIAARARDAEGVAGNGLSCYTPVSQPLSPKISFCFN